MLCHTVIQCLPDSCYLILHFKSPKAPVDCVHYCIALVTTSPSIKAGENDPMWTGEVRAPVELETIVHSLAAGASVPTQHGHSGYHPMHTFTGSEQDAALRRDVHSHVNEKRVFFSFLKIWWQHHLIPQICSEGKKGRQIVSKLEPQGNEK